MMNIKIVLSLLALGFFSSHALFSMNEDASLFEKIIRAEKECGPHREILAGKSFRNGYSVKERVEPTHRVIYNKRITKPEKEALDNFPRLNDFLINNLRVEIIPEIVEPEKLHLIARAFLFTHNIKNAANYFDKVVSYYEKTREYVIRIYNIFNCLKLYKLSNNNIADADEFSALFNKIEELSKEYDTESLDEPF
jgi:hypothetical protein